MIGFKWNESVYFFVIYDLILCNCTNRQSGWTPTPFRLIGAPVSAIPSIFYAICRSLHNPANLSWLGTGTKYAGLHTRWLGASACVVFILLQKIQKVAKCTFWYRLTRVVPDRVQGDVKWLCVVCLCNCISTLITAVLFEFLGRCNDCLQSYDAVGQHWNCPATDLERFPSGSSGKKKLRQK